MIKITTEEKPNTQQHVPYRGDQSDGEEEGKEEEQVLEEISIEEGLSDSKDTEGLNATLPSKPKRFKKLKQDRRGSPPRERSRSRMRSGSQKV